LIVDPFDEDAWIHAIRELAGNREKRLAMGCIAHERADFYLWAKVAKRRRLALQERIG
jgi:glycosyltransferase involved in cell wall biosynthesis